MDNSLVLERNIAELQNKKYLVQLLNWIQKLNHKGLNAEIG